MNKIIFDLLIESNTIMGKEEVETIGNYNLDITRRPSSHPQNPEWFFEEQVIRLAKLTIIQDLKDSPVYDKYYHTHNDIKIMNFQGQTNKTFSLCNSIKRI